MPKLKPYTLFPTQQEEARILAGIHADPDAYSLSDLEWEKIKSEIRRGCPGVHPVKERITLRLSRDVLAQFRSAGDDWQTRIDTALRQYLTEHPAGD